MGTIADRSHLFCESFMKVGDLVKVDNYHPLIGGKTGIIIEIQPGKYCVGAYILFGDYGITLVRVENLRVQHV